MIEDGQKLAIVITFFALGMAAFNIMYFSRAIIRRAIRVSGEVKTPERPEEKPVAVEFHEMSVSGPYSHSNGKVKAAKVEHRS